MGGPRPTPGGLREGNMLWLRGSEEKAVAEEGNYHEYSVEQAGIGIMGVPTETAVGVRKQSGRD